MIIILPPRSHLAQSLVIDEGAISAAVVSDSVAGLPLFVGNGSVGLAHL